MKYDVKIITKIEDIDSMQVDTLSTCLFTTHKFLKVVEEFDGINIDPRYICVFEKEKLVGFAAFYIQTDALFDNLNKCIYGPFSFLSKYLFINLSPCLACYCPIGLVTNVYKLGPSLEDKNSEKEIFKELLHGAENAAKDAGLDIICLLNINPAEEDDVVLKNCNYVKSFSIYENIIKIDPAWNSFDDFVNSQKHGKKTISREKIKVVNSKIKSAIMPNPDNLYEVINLIDGTFIKYTARKSKFNVHLFERLSIELQDKFAFILHYNKKELISAGNYFISQNSLQLFKVGHTKDSGFSFFDSVVYIPVELCIKNKYSELNLGTSFYKYKILRGAKLRPLYNYTKCLNFPKHTLLKKVLPHLSKVKQKKHNHMFSELTDGNIDNVMLEKHHQVN